MNLGFTSNEDLIRLHMPSLNNAIIIEEEVEEDEELIDLKFIINNKPDTETVREFMRFQLQSIKNEEDEIFLRDIL